MVSQGSLPCATIKYVYSTTPLQVESLPFLITQPHPPLKIGSVFTVFTWTTFFSTRAAMLLLLSFSRQSCPERSLARLSSSNTLGCPGSPQATPVTTIRGKPGPRLSATDALPFEILRAPLVIAVFDEVADWLELTSFEEEASIRTRADPFIGDMSWILLSIRDMRHNTAGAAKVERRRWG